VIFHDGLVLVVDPTSGTHEPGFDPIPIGKLRLRLYPNPAIGSEAICIDLEGGTPEWIDVLDPQGRKVWNWTGPWTESGPFVLPVGKTGPASRPVPPGFYFCRVRSAGRQATSGFVLIR
jgi:hypothetical protein